MSAEIIDLAGYRPPSPQERLEAIVTWAAGVLGHGDQIALEVLNAMAACLSDLNPTEFFGVNEEE